jgi:hypothetical protein
LFEQALLRRIGRRIFFRKQYEGKKKGIKKPRHSPGCLLKYASGRGKGAAYGLEVVTNQSY